MTFAELTQSLRDTSARFGAIPDFLAAADGLDRALSAFFKAQTLESLRDLNGALARAEKLRKGVVVGKVADEDMA